MRISELCKIAHKQAIDAGFWEKDTGGNWIKRNLGELIALIHSELSEALEALRHNRLQPANEYCHFLGKNKLKLIKKAKWEKDTFSDELADAVIRICDLAQSEGIDLEWQIEKKLAFNRTRPKKHGKEF
jgi:NTP pyrophosphatase (non-canonical NTP hydrolase)